VTPRFYFDEDSLDQALILALKARGLDVESALTAGMRRRSDRDQLAYATEQGRGSRSTARAASCRIALGGHRWEEQFPILASAGPTRNLKYLLGAIPLGGF
jgi:hypothetical protein